MLNKASGCCIFLLFPVVIGLLRGWRKSEQGHWVPFRHEGLGLWLKEQALSTTSDSKKKKGKHCLFLQNTPPTHTHKHIQIHTDIHKHRHTHTYKRHREDFPGGAVVKNSPANARKHGFNPRSGKIPHALEQRSPLSPFATTTEPAWHTYWSPSTKSLCSATREATEMRSLRTATKSSPWSLLLEKVPVQQGRPSTAKNK